MQPISYAPHEFPPEIICHAIWLYLRFTLSYRDVEELLTQRGLDVSYETIRRWVLNFGPAFTCNLRRLRPRPTGTWHLDEMVVWIQGRRMYLWRAVDSEGEILEILVQPRRDTAAALKLMRKLLKKQGFAPDVLITDKLPSYGAARRELGLSAHHEQRPAQEQPGRELPSGGATTRAEDAGLQVTWVSPALPQRSFRRLQHLQLTTPSDLPPYPPPVPTSGGGAMADCDRSDMTEAAAD